MKDPDPDEYNDDSDDASSGFSDDASRGFSFLLLFLLLISFCSFAICLLCIGLLYSLIVFDVFRFVKSSNDEDTESTENIKNQHNWRVGIWELRLGCYTRNLENQDNEHDHENHLIGTELVYQHENQYIKVFEPGGHGIPVIASPGLDDVDQNEEK